LVQVVHLLVYAHQVLVNIKEVMQVQHQLFQQFHQQVVGVVAEVFVDQMVQVIQEHQVVVAEKEHHQDLLQRVVLETLLQLLLHKEMMVVLVVLQVTQQETLITAEAVVEQVPVGVMLVQD
tara:strand:+ start:122 stop:484 length:363 start_codon:yes stop_codon:yes gene_type:complete